jgi:RNA polymerase-binding transcription factor DksA
MPAKGLSKKELKEFRDLLLARRKILLGDVEGLENEALKKKGGDSELSTLPLHMADLGTDNFEQDITLGLMESESDELQEVNEALARIKDGSFGLCEGCKKPVPKARLRAIPYTRLCVDCKKKEEGV